MYLGRADDGYQSAGRFAPDRRRPAVPNRYLHCGIAVIVATGNIIGLWGFRRCADCTRKAAHAMGSWESPAVNDLADDLARQAERSIANSAAQMSTDVNINLQLTAR